MEKFDFIDSKFRLAILASRRAKQLVGGSKKKVTMIAENVLTIALQEIYEGKIHFEIFDEERFRGLEMHRDDSPIMADEESAAESFLIGDTEEPDIEEESGE